MSRRQVIGNNLERDSVQHLLDRFLSMDKKAGSQTFVTLYQLLEGGLDPDNIQIRGNRNHVGHIVIDILPFHLLQDEQPFLRRRKGVVILFFRRLDAGESHGGGGADEIGES